MEHVPCPLCGERRHRLLFERRDHTHACSDQPFRVVRCRSCGFAFVNPRPGPDEIHTYYPDAFYEASMSAEAVLASKRDSLAAKLALVAHLPAGRLLDVGCQKGEFMYAMQQRGWKVQGVELSARPPNLFGLPILRGRLEEAALPDAAFDLITLWAVLEHVHDPISVLRAVRRLLAPGGRAVVLVPNFRSIPGRFLRHDDVPRHLLMFTPRTLRHAARRCGLRVQRTVFGDAVFSGSTRGTLNYLWKLAHGERLDDIVAQNRTPGRWMEFAACLHGAGNPRMLRVDRLDIRLTPLLDRVVNRLRLGFIMTAELSHAEGGR
jgi:2-polyprenyl-3-methyl-5-hydroxy-6-metoxy-1,4-benzoquinol methylase